MHKRFPSMRKVFFALCKSVDSPVSLGAWLRFEHDQLALAKMEVNPRDYLDCQAFRYDYLVVSFLSKWKGLRTGLDLEAEAMKKFISSEDLCAETNVRIRKGRNLGHPAEFEHVFYRARRKIASLLGPYSNHCLDPGFGWGPGATDDLTRRTAFLDTKICETPISCTPAAQDLFLSILALDRHWQDAILNDRRWRRKPADVALLCLTTRNVVDTVPKNAKTHRVIAKEPRANAFLQKGAGAWIRKRLKRVGIDLDDQGANQEGAHRAYREGLATLDLKAASDTMSVELVYELLPIDWADSLDCIRSRESILPGGEIRKLEKFSSMGNGFTFELETLLFWAISSSVMEEQSIEGSPLVYGDDIIVPKSSAQPVIEALNYAGFEVNTSKSYIEGNFFESCGKHYFQGVDVTPIYQKEVVENTLTSIRLSNRLLRQAVRMGFGRLDRKVWSAWLTSIRNTDFNHFQLPLGAEGDEGWLAPSFLFTKVQYSKNYGLRCRVLRLPDVRFPADDRALLAHTLRLTAHRSTPPGVDASLPYLGEIARSSELPVKGERWVHPTSEFRLELDD